ncbi:hypothetical protein [Flavimobilis soli]|uniref:hypothetical protein n=1 Tax=Flavimobilis soli TaxID=442709 RepID=UPI001FEB9054|nr:hypothetical protein [Flavimobilis soli]
MNVTSGGAAGVVVVGAGAGIEGALAALEAALVGWVPGASSRIDVATASPLAPTTDTTAAPIRMRRPREAPGDRRA